MEGTKVINVKLDDGSQIKIEASQFKNKGDGNKEEIGFEQKIEEKVYEFKSMTSTITSISKDIVASAKGIGLSKIAVKFGLEVGVEAGNIIAVIAKATGKANLEITCEWSK